jgi:hypothetical protein
MSEDEVNEYLWNKSGAPDPEVRKLEELLGRYRLEPERLPGDPAPRRARGRLFSLRAFVAIAAGLLVAALIFWAVTGFRTTGYRVIGVEGRDLVREGEGVSTGSQRGARLEIGWLGHVDIEPNSHVAVEDCGRDAHRLFLQRGSVKAKIWAQPRLFQIGTPAGNSIDLGCEYELDVADDGRSVLRVTTGQVAFEFEGREIYVPAGWTCVSDPKRGPGAPVNDEASAEYRAALSAVEFAADPDPALVAQVLDVGHEGTLTLWHLLISDETAPSLRHAAFEKLAKAYPRPDGVTEAGLVGGDAKMREAWMDEMKWAWR